MALSRFACHSRQNIYASAGLAEARTAGKLNIQFVPLFCPRHRASWPPGRKILTERLGTREDVRDLRQYMTNISDAVKQAAQIREAGHLRQVPARQHRALLRVLGTRLLAFCP
jgi:hypothetical protein